MSEKTGGDAVYTTIGKHLISLIIPVLVGIGSSAITTTITITRLEERVTHLERKVDVGVMLSETLRARDDEFERRVSRTETLLETISQRMVEIGGDVKSLLQRMSRNEKP